VKHWTLSATALLATACVQPPAVQQRSLDVEPPHRWSVASDAAGPPLVAWWETFDDAQLGELIEIALVQNNDLRAAAHRVDRVAAAGHIAAADLKPTVGVGFNAQRQQQVLVGLPVPGLPNVLSSTSTQFALTFETSWEVDLWGRLRAGTRAALAQAQAAEADLRGARLSLSGQTAKLWFAVTEAQQQLDLARESVATFTTSTELVRRTGALAL